MTTVDHPPLPVPDLAAPGRLGQGTAIEQSRAVEEVRAMVIVAKQAPRSTAAAVERMRESCRQKALAERAFYRYPRGGQTVSGPSVHLARELARCFGNVTYGIGELRRDDEHGQSEMQAFAWDLETNTRSSQIFIVPHMRDKKGGPERLTDMRDIYETTANNGARRVREAIFAILPPWFVEEAKDLCAQTLADGGGVPLAKRAADAAAAFEELGITADQLEQKVGRRRDQWTDHDLAQLHVTYKSLQRGEVTVEDEFPPQRVTTDELTRRRAPAAPAAASALAGDDRQHDQAQQPPPPSAPPPDEDVGRLSPQQYGALREAGIDDAKRGPLTLVVTDGRTDSTTELTSDERRRILNAASAISLGQLELIVEGPGGEPALFDLARDLPLPSPEILDEYPRGDA